MGIFYINSTDPSWYQHTKSSNTLLILNDNFTMTGVTGGMIKKINDVTQVIDHDFNRILLQKKKKARFKQSKFDQINSFGKKNVNSR